MKKFLCAITALLLMFTSLPIYVSASDDIIGDFVEGEILLKYTPPLTLSSVSNEKSLLQAFDELELYDVEKLECYDNSLSLSSCTEEECFYTVKTNGDVEEICNELEKVNGVEYAEPNYLLEAYEYTEPAELTASYDYIDNQQWYFNDVLKIPTAWEQFNTTGEGVTVAVIDNGFYVDAMDFPTNLWNDGNGNHGWNVAENNADILPTLYLNGTAVSNSYHGTHVASTIGMSANGSGGLGVAYNAELMLVKVARDNTEMTVASLVSGLYYAANNGADVINMSLGGVESSAEKEAIDYAYDMGCVIVAAAGNSAKSSDDAPAYPAAYPNVIGVMASDKKKMNQLALFSNYGELYDVAVPGVDILGSTTNSEELVIKKGTSMASPIVTGLAALYISSKNNPTNEQVCDAIRNSAAMLVRSNASIVRSDVYYYDLLDAVSLLSYDGTSTQNNSGLYLDANGGVGITVKNLSYGDTLGSLPTPVREGYTFKGWYTAQLIGSQVSGNTEFTEDLPVIYARWRANTYTITLDADGGTHDGETISLSYDSDYWDLPIPEKDGYYFVGWYTDSQFKNPAKVDSFGSYSFCNISIARNHTVYARWSSGENMAVHFVDNVTHQQFSDITVDYNGTYGSLPVPQEAAGYTFLGWWWNESSGTYYTDTSTVEFPYEHTLYAIWKTENYTVTFDANGGECANTAISVQYGKFYPKDMPIPTLDGMYFVGWYTIDDEPALEVRFGKINLRTVTTKRDHTLYAKWSDGKNIKVHFVDKYTQQSFGDVTVNYGEKYTVPTVSDVPGFTFLGWSEYGNTTDNLITNDTTVVTACEHTLYAVWRYETFVFNIASGFNFDTQKKLLSGFNPNNLTGENLLNAFKNPNAVISSLSGKIGTGTEIQLKTIFGNVYDTATVVVYGDVNCDGACDATDAVIAECIESGMLNDTADCVSAAADCNHDGKINAADEQLMQDAGLSLTTISQM